MLKEYVFLYYEVLGPYKVTIILAQALNWNMNLFSYNSPLSV